MVPLSLMIKRYFVYSIIHAHIGWRPVIAATRRPAPLNDQQNIYFYLRPFQLMFRIDNLNGKEAMSSIKVFPSIMNEHVES